MNVLEITDIGQIVGDADRIAELRAEILDGTVVIARSAIDRGLVADLVEYLTRVGRNSLPTYAPIEIGASNFHRLNNSDERSYVEGSFHQFVFYPWNQDVFDLFAVTQDLFRFKSALSGMPPDLYLGREGHDGIVARLPVQFYPSGSGYMNRHQDPVGSHQLTVPTVTLSTKGVDFESGGLFVEDSEGRRCEVDDLTSPGDAVFVDARLVHGVDLVDSGDEPDWLSFHGRWSMLIATNKLANNDGVSDAVDLGTG
jgi:hypothetical protein